jgi:hypothetical protein
MYEVLGRIAGTLGIVGILAFFCLICAANEDMEGVGLGAAAVVVVCLLGLAAVGVLALWS